MTSAIPVNKPIPLPPWGTWPDAVHLFDQKSADALLAARLARRPLLVCGEPGSGKSQLARAALSELAERQRIDVIRLVAAQARLHPLRRLPRLRAPRWVPAGQLILDLSSRLYPFWGDFAAIKGVVPRLRGRTGLEILCMEQGPEGPVRAWDGQDWSVPRPYCAPVADVPVLILGDLGCLGTPAERQAWERLGRQFRANGPQAVVLTPYPSRWWDPAPTLPCCPAACAFRGALQGQRPSARRGIRHRDVQHGAIAEHFGVSCMTVSRAVKKDANRSVSLGGQCEVWPQQGRCV
jgi:hypothetical protein